MSGRAGGAVRRAAAGPEAVRGRRRLRAGAAATAVAGALAGAASAGAVTGVCPDGSIFIVKDASQIPCSRSKQIEPHEVPPLRAENLPTPYTWQVWQEQQNPNNPYNLIDAARQVRGLETPGVGEAAPGSAPRGAGAPQGAGLPAVSSAPPPGEPAERAVGPLDLGLSDQELRDLFLIVELSQERVPARFRRETADGRDVFEVSLAHSQAFEARLREAWASRGGLGPGRVLLFTALAKQPEDFRAHFTFVQGHLTFQPEPHDPRQMGILQGRLGALEGREAVLGYVVLPENLSLGEQLDVYWNDRRTTVRFAG